MWLSNSSIGRKVVMSITGLFLVLFLTFHMCMNLVALISPAGYNAVCQFLGANWYALAGTVILAAGAVLHIVYAFWLTLQNRKARGNDRYLVNTRPQTVEWASQNMLVLGIIVLLGLVLHLFNFWYKMQLNEIVGHLPEVNPHDGIDPRNIRLPDLCSYLSHLVRCFVVPSHSWILECHANHRYQQPRMVQPLEMYLQHFRNNHLLGLCRRCHLFLCDEPDRLRNLHPLINQTIYSQKNNCYVYHRF